jgi:hypothetical protein
MGKAVDPLILADPESCRVPKEIPIPKARALRRDIDEMVGCFIPSADSPPAKQPYVTVVVPDQSIDDVRRHSVLPPIGAEHAIVIPDHATINAVEPEVSTPALYHGAELVRKEAGCLSVEDSQMDAVETCQSIEGSNPQISIGCLSDAAYLVLRQTIVDCPGLEAVLSMRRADYAEENCQLGNKT